MPNRQTGRDSVVWNSDTLAILNKARVYLYRKLGELRQIGRHDRERPVEIEETEVPYHQGLAPDREPKAGNPRLRRERLAPFLQYRKMLVRVNV